MPSAELLGGERSSDSEVPQKILLIDDDDHITRVAALFLRRNGFEVFVAGSGEDGVRAASECLPDLVVCDLEMPRMSGFDVLASLRQDVRFAEVPFVFLTGRIAPQDIREGMNVGADDYLTKPMDPEELLRTIKARLARARALRQSQAQQTERAMRMFAEVVHDLRDPLFAVLGYANLLRHDRAEPAQTDCDEAEILDRMQQAIGRMQSIVSETLFLAKSKMRRLPFDPCAFDLRVLCEQIIADQEQPSRLCFEGGEGECSTVGDPLRLRQAIENLISNGLKYSDATVTVRVLRRDSGWQIDVVDHGIGIPKAEREKIFEPFFRGSNTKGKPGYGLGLSVVKACAEQHGGKVEFETAAGQTTFSLVIPSLPPRAMEEAVHPRPPGELGSPAAALRGVSNSAANRPAKGGTETAPPLSCIIVDDDPLVRDVLRILMTRSGQLNVVAEAGSVAQARQVVEQHSPAVVFLDISLPDASGFELLPHLGPATAVVFVTSAEEYAINAFESDAVDYLVKPVSAERLQRAITRVRQRMAAAPMVPKEGRLGLDDTFLVKTMSEKKLIKVRDLKSIIAYGEYSWVYWDQGKGALLRKPLKQWESELPADQFVRVHRNSIINLAFTERVEKLPSGRLQVHLRGTDQPIAVSLRLAPELNRKLKSFRS